MFLVEVYLKNVLWFFFKSIFLDYYIYACVCVCIYIYIYIYDSEGKIQYIVLSIYLIMTRSDLLWMMTD